MSLYAAYGTFPVLTARVVVPRIGPWYAELVLAVEAELNPVPAGPQPLTLSLADIAWTATAWRSAPYQGRTIARIIGGFAGWQRQLPTKHYQAPAGVLLSTVLADAARECGEQVTVATDRALGAHFVRDVGPAARMLNRLADGGWHVGLGLDSQKQAATIVGPWLSDASKAPITTPFQLLGFDGGAGVATIATETLSAFTPDRTFSSPLVPGRTFTISAVVHTLDKATVRTEVHCAEVRP